MNEIKVSVIVPIYNAEVSLVKCLDSIVSQSYKNLEIILVNDGSTDSSGTIIEDYAEKDKRIEVIHKLNGGIGSAYRVALEKVSGDYISFVDSDDYIDLTMFEELIVIVRDKNPDIIHFGMEFVNDKRETFQLFSTSNQTIDGKSNILNYHFTIFKFPSLACRLFRKNLFTGVIFFDQNIGMDEMAIIQILPKCNKAVYITRIMYYAYAHSESVSRIKYSKNKIREGVKVHQFICNYMEEHNKNYSPYLYIKYLNYLLFVYDIGRADKEIRGSEEISTVMNNIHIYYQKAKSTYEFMNTYSELKLKVQAFALSPHLYSFVSWIMATLRVFKDKYKYRMLEIVN